MNTVKFLLPVLAIALIFTGCSKSNSEQLREEMTSHAKTPTTTTISFSENPVVLGNPVTITGTITPIPDGGKLRVEMAVDADGNPTTAALAVTYLNVEEVNGELGEVVHTFTPLVIGQTGYRIHFIPSGGTDYSQHHTAGVDLLVVNNCTAMNLAAAITHSSMTGNVGTFTVTYRLTSCANYSNVKIQGGLTAGSENVVAAGGSIKTNKQNTIISWNESVVGIGFDKSYSVSFTKKLNGAGPWAITGDWSAKGKDENGVEFVAGYNNVQIFYAPF